MQDLKDEELIRTLKRAELTEYLIGKDSLADDLQAQKIFAILVERHHKPFARLIALRYPVDGASADEITQDFWLECYAALPRYNPERPFLSWATTILFRTAEKFLKKRRKEVQLSPQHDFFDQQASKGEGIESETLSRNQIDGMLVALRKLPADLALLIQLRFFEEKKIEDIMAATGLARSTVFDKLNLAYKKLRKFMEAGNEP